MSEIATVLNFLSEVVTKTVDFTLNILFTCLLVASAVAPWRWGEIERMVREDETRRHGWKSICLASFLLTVADFVAVPSILAGLLSPLRWSHTFRLLQEYACSCGQGAVSDFYERRWKAIPTIFYVTLDAICLPFGLIVLLSPFGRQVALFTTLSTLQFCADYQGDDFDMLFFIDYTLFVGGCQTIFDIGTFLCFPPLIIALTTWRSTYSCLADCLKDQPVSLDAPARITYYETYVESWTDFINKIRSAFLSCVALAALDIMTALPFLCAFVSPLRHGELMRLISPPQQHHIPAERGTEPYSPLEDGIGAQNTGHNSSSPPVPLVAAVISAPMQVPPPRPTANFQVRFEILRLGALAVADALLYPMIAILWLTRYRYSTIQGTLTGNNHWGSTELFLVFSQFSFLTVDIFVFALPTFMLWSTRLRWARVLDKLKQTNVLATNTFGIYRRILHQLAYLVVDFFTLPFYLVVFLTVYRVPHILPVIFHPHVWRKALEINLIVVINALVIVHDSLFMAPSLVIITLLSGCHRLYYLRVFYAEKSVYWMTRRRTRHENYLLDNRAAVRSQNMGRVEETRMAENPSTIAPVEIPVPLDHVLQDGVPHFSVRWAVWEELVCSFLDVPFYAMAVLVIMTFWRAQELISIVYELIYGKKTSAASPLTASSVKETFGEVRLAVAKQFWKWLGDLLALLPLALVIGTVYKLPQLVADLVALFREQSAVKGKPLFIARRCQLTWTVGNDPVLQIQLTRNHSSPESSNRTSAPTSIHGDSSVRINASSASDFQLQVVSGKRLWLEIGRQFGMVISAVLKSLLPLKLTLGEHVGVIVQDAESVLPSPITVDNEVIASPDDIRIGLLKDADDGDDKLLSSETEGFSQDKKANSNEDSAIPSIPATESLVANTAPPQPPMTTQDELWIKLPLGNAVKRSTLIKKLRLLNASTVINLQIACQVDSVVSSFETIAASSDLSRAQDTHQKVRVPYTYLLLRVSDVLEAMTSQTVAETTADLPLIAQESTFYEAFDAERSPPKVDRLAIMVVTTALLVLKDLGHLLLLLVLMLLSPQRFCQCLYRMFSDDATLNKLAMKNAWFALRQGEVHLRYLRRLYQPLLSEEVKRHVYEDSGNRSRIAAVDTTLQDEQFERDSSFHLKRYRYYQKRTAMRITECISGAAYALDSAWLESYQLTHDQIFNWQVARYQVWLALSMTPSSSPLASVTQEPGWSKAREKLQLAGLVCSEEHDRWVDELLQRKGEMRSVVQTGYRNADALQAAQLAQLKEASDEVEAQKQKKSKCCSKKAWTRWMPSLHPTFQSIIRTQIRRALTDLGGIAVICFLLVTVVRILPLLSDLLRTDREPIHYKSVLAYHATLVAHDLYHMLRLIVFLLLILITVISIPGYLSHAPAHMTSWKDAAYTAKLHWTTSIYEFLELILLITAYRTYKVLAKAALYCLLLPGAMLAEALESMSLRYTTVANAALQTVRDDFKKGTRLRFAVGSALFAGLAIAAIVLATDRSMHRADAVQTNHAVLILILVTVAVQVIIGFGKFKASLTPSRAATVEGTSFGGDVMKRQQLHLRWDHILGLLLGPVECLCLSSVVMFFYWQPLATWTSHDSTTFNSTTASSSLGADHLSQLLFWNTPNNTSTSILQTAITLATVFALLWGVLLALPLAQDSRNDVLRHQRKIHAVLSAASFQALSFLVAQLLGVWIMATLLRPYSCIDYATVDSGGTSSVRTVMSSALLSACGTNSGYAVGKAALPLFVHFLLTTSLMHPSFYQPHRTETHLAHFDVTDDAYYSADFYDGARINRRRLPPARTTGVERSLQAQLHDQFLTFGALYQLCVRSVQAVVLLLCFTLVGATPAIIVLSILLALTLLVVVVPSYLSIWSTTSTEDRSSLCNVPSVFVLRTASYAALAWTIVVCLVRACVFAQHNTDDDLTQRHGFAHNSIFATEATIYIGWGVIYAITIAIIIHYEYCLRRDWKELVRVSDLQQTLQDVSVLYRFLTGDLDLHALATHRAMTEEDGHAGNGASPVASPAAPITAQQANKWRWLHDQLASCDSVESVVQLILRLEQAIPVDRLSTEFLRQRQEWIQALTTIGQEWNAGHLEHIEESTDTEAQPPTNNNHGTLPDTTEMDNDRAIAALIAADLQDVENPSYHPPLHNAELLEAGNLSLQPPQETTHQGETREVQNTVPSTRVVASSRRTLPRAMLHHLQALSAKVQVLIAANRGADQSATSYLTRSVLSTLLSYRRIPLEISHIIFSYLIDLRHVRQILVYNHYPLQYHVNAQFMVQLSLSRYRTEYGLYQASVGRAQLINHAMDELQADQQVAVMEKASNHAAWMNNAQERRQRRIKAWSHLLQKSSGGSRRGAGVEYFDDLRHHARTGMSEGLQILLDPRYDDVVTLHTTAEAAQQAAHQVALTDDTFGRVVFGNTAHGHDEAEVRMERSASMDQFPVLATLRNP